MTWDPSTSCGLESDKIAAHVVKYLQGRALDIGCGLRPVWPRVIGYDSGETFKEHTRDVIRGEANDLSLFVDESFDAVFSSHMLEDLEEDAVPAMLAEWARVIRPGGYLCLYVPSANLYPKVGEPGANPAHRWDIYPGDLEKKLLGATSCGWTQVECEERGDTNEYSLFEVYQKRADGIFENASWQRNPDGKKRALVIRLGAIGDQIVASSVLGGLKKQGFHVTYNTTPDAQQIVLHDPNIDDWLIQERDWVPNVQLGALWDSWAPRYDRVINLCESIEGSLLKLPGRLEHGYPDEARRRLYGSVNYLERTADIAAIPHTEISPRFYPTPTERRQAIDRLPPGPVVAWAVAGSSIHKYYPHIPPVVGWLLDKTNASIVLLGDAKEGLMLQEAILTSVGANPRLYGRAGQWNIREALAFAQVADVVVGPETGVLNAVCFEENAKVVYLSHSSRDNLTRLWRNTIALTPNPVKAKCYPCHRLHYDGTFCHKDEETQAALCAAGVAPESVFRAIMQSLGQKAVREAAD